MDILTHTLSGVAAGTCLAVYAKKDWKQQAGILSFSGLGGAFPDIDAISLWSRFDGTWGKWLGLSHSGKVIYSEKFWYSHHGFIHSLLAVLVMTIIVGSILFLFSGKKENRLRSFYKSFQQNKLLLSGFALGYIIHLLEDIPTPAGSWGGIRLFFPMEIFVGGTGDVWWWNNYDLFLIVLIVISVNFILLALSYLPNISVNRAVLSVFLIGCLFGVVQIKTRGFNFNSKPYQSCEDKSKEIQKELLGKELYHAMERLDRSLKIYF